MIACGGGGDGTGTDQATEDPSTAGPTTTTPPTTDPSTTQAPEVTTSESTTAIPTTEATSSTGDPSDTDDTTTDTTTTGGFDCNRVPSGPFTAERIFDDVPFAASEDLGFDGQGHLAARGQGGAYLRVSADGTYTEIASDPRPTYGLRFLANGDIVAAAYQSGTILRITARGDVSALVTGLGGVNGLFPGPEGGVWYTNFQVVGYVDDGGSAMPVVAPATSANGVWYDEARQLVFFTNYGSGALRKAQLIDGVAQTPVEIGTIPGAPDGITFDVCGNLYVVDQGNADLYRLPLDAAAEPLGPVELLVPDGFPTNVANAQFGSGPGWEPESLYVLGVPGALYRVDVGVPGATYVTVQ